MIIHTATNFFYSFNITFSHSLILYSVCASMPLCWIHWSIFIHCPMYSTNKYTASIRCPSSGLPPSPAASLPETELPSFQHPSPAKRGQRRCWNVAVEQKVFSSANLSLKRRPSLVARTKNRRPWSIPLISAWRRRRDWKRKRGRRQASIYLSDVCSTVTFQHILCPPETDAGPTAARSLTEMRPETEGGGHPKKGSGWKLHGGKTVILL